MSSEPSSQEMGSPRATVLLVAHNQMRFLQGAVECILAQTMTDWELLAIDDGSTDYGGRYFDTLDDPRVRAIHNAEHLGLCDSLNIGLDAARGAYIAMMAPDNLCDPNRLARQVEFLDSHPGVGAVGCSRRLIDEQANDISIARATQSEFAVRWKCLLANPLSLCTTMLRGSVIRDRAPRFDPEFRDNFDYEFWTRLLQYCEADNLPEALVSDRLRAQALDPLEHEQRMSRHDRVSLLACQRLLEGFAISADDVRELRGRFGGYELHEKEMDASDPHWLELYTRMLKAFSAEHLSPLEMSMLGAAG